MCAIYTITCRRNQEKKMFAVGHIALGYILGTINGKFIGHNPNIPLLWIISLAPDIDFLIPSLQHRGPTHSLILVILLMMPLILTRSSKSTPYFAALATHSVGDYITNGGAQILWPLNAQWYKIKWALSITNPLEPLLEVSLFVILVALLFSTKDIKRLIQSKNVSNIYILPLTAILFLSALRYPIPIPSILTLPHLALLIIIILPLLKNLSLTHV